MKLRICIIMCIAILTIVGCGNEANEALDQSVGNHSLQQAQNEEKIVVHGRGGVFDGDVEGDGNTKRDNITYDESYDGELAQEIVNELNNEAEIKNSRVVFYKDTVFVAVQTDQSGEKLKKKVSDHVHKLTGNSQIQVFTDREHVQQLFQIDNQLREGRPIEQVGPQNEHFFRAIRRIFQRPFEHDQYGEGDGRLKEPMQ